MKIAIHNFDIRKLFIFFVIFCTLQGCAGIYTALKDEGKGKTQRFLANREVVRDVIPRALATLGLEIVDEDKRQGLFFAEGKPNNVSYGERVVILVQEETESSTLVKVISRKEWVHNSLATDWETPVLNALDKALSNP